MKNQLTFTSAQGFCHIQLSEEYAQFAVLDDGARDALKTALLKLDEFEAKYIGQTVLLTPQAGNEDGV